MNIQPHFQDNLEHAYRRSRAALDALFELQNVVNDARIAATVAAGGDGEWSAEDTAINDAFVVAIHAATLNGMAVAHALHAAGIPLPRSNSEVTFK